jgi:periplasmic protein TonB
MFADSLLDSSFTNRSYRGWTTLASFALQALAVGMLLMLPLIYTEGLPRLRLMTIGAPVGVPRGQRAEVTHHASSATRANLHAGQIVAPQQIPTQIAQGADEIAIPDVDACVDCVPGGTGPPGAHNGILDGIENSAAILPPPPKPTAPAPRVSRIMEGNLIYKPEPVYPSIARSMRIQGPVVLRAFISRSGTIENLQVLSGHPLLVKAALDAVGQWRYRPYVLNGEAVEVETQVTVNFILSGG